MAVDTEEIKKIADLADLNLSEEEIKQYSNDMTDILDFMEVLEGVDISNVQIVLGANERYNNFRKDEIVEPLSQEDALRNAPSQEEGMIHLPKVIV